MTRTRRRLVLLLIATVVALAGLLLAVRTLRHHADDPVIVAPGIARVRNFIADMYAARAGDGVVLFDAGVGEDGAALDRLMGALGARREDVTDVYLTHGHFDHVAGARLCTAARIHIGTGDRDLLAHRARPARFMVRQLTRLMPVGPIAATHLLDGAVKDDQTGVLAIPVPGHTPGSYVFYHAGVLFTGDSMQIEGDSLVGAMPIFTVDVGENARSLAGLGQALAGRRLDFVCSGHGGCTPPGRAQAMLDELMTRLAPLAPAAGRPLGEAPAAPRP